MKAPKPFDALRDALSDNWRLRARPSQLPPSGNAWNGWLLLAGRGFGKTFVLTSYCNELAQAGAGGRFAIIGPTAADVRDVLIRGESGILRTAPAHFMPKYEPSKRLVEWPNGARALCFSAEEPERLRGPQHTHAFCDEIAAWTNATECWNQLMFGLRLGSRPRWIAATTPRPLKLIKDLLARAERDVVVTRGSSFENAENLAPSFLAELRARYEGTRLGRQEILAELLEDVQGALWTRDMLERARYQGAVPDCKRVVVSIDPSGTRGDSDSGDSVGICVAGIGTDGLGYILADLTIKASPAVWGARAVQAYHSFKADRIIAERNYGGSMVEHVIRTVDPNIPYREVTASRGKIARAEPIAALYEQNRVRHCGAFTELEDQLCAMTGEGFSGDGSPDRADALVWALSELMTQIQAPQAMFGTYSSATPMQSYYYDPSARPKSKFDGKVSVDGGNSFGWATSRS
jgi:phage terminase large subunit-like protein